MAKERKHYKDNKFLEVAAAGQADWPFHPFREIPIVTPAQFLAMLDEKNAG